MRPFRARHIRWIPQPSALPWTGNPVALSAPEDVPETKGIDTMSLVAVCMGQFWESAKTNNGPSTLAISAMPRGEQDQQESIPEVA
jgi:hypothetical protein